jgi:hypothetical protein
MEETSVFGKEVQWKFGRGTNRDPLFVLSNPPVLATAAVPKATATSPITSMDCCKHPDFPIVA